MASPMLKRIEAKRTSVIEAIERERERAKAEAMIRQQDSLVDAAGCKPEPVSSRKSIDVGKAAAVLGGLASLLCAVI